MRNAAYYLAAAFFGLVALSQFARVITATPLVIGGAPLSLPFTAATAIISVGLGVYMAMEARRRGRFHSSPYDHRRTYDQRDPYQRPIDRFQSQVDRNT
jgi:hypothetical protein